MIPFEVMESGKPISIVLDLGREEVLYYTINPDEENNMQGFSSPSTFQKANSQVEPTPEATATPEPVENDYSWTDNYYYSRPKS